MNKCDFEVRFSFRFFLIMSYLLIIGPATPVVPQQWSDLVTRVPCVTVGGRPEGEDGVNRSSPRMPGTGALPSLLPPQARHQRGRCRERSSSRLWRTWLQLSCGGPAHAPLPQPSCPTQEDTQSTQGDEDRQHGRDSHWQTQIMLYKQFEVDKRALRSIKKPPNETECTILISAAEK